MEGSVVPSLVNLCLDEIVRRFEFFSVYLEQPENIGTKHLLQSKWTHALFQKMGSAFRTKYASFFMNPYLEGLDFTKFSLIDINEELCKICDMKIFFDDQQGDGGAGKRCRKKPLIHQHEDVLFLTQLETCTQVRKVLVSLRLANMLPHTLKSLRLHDMECLDMVLKCVGTKCSNLQELALYGCGRVTDILIYDLFSEGRPINASLRKLNLLGTSVTAEGILVVLERCQKLVELLHTGLGSAISSSYHNQISNNIWPLKRYNLQKIITLSTYVQECVELCPDVQAIVIESVANQVGPVLYGKFKKLKKFHVHGVSVSLSRFLEILGSDLEVLGIYANCTFSVKALVEFCPNVQQLNLYNPNFERNENLKIDVTQFSLQYLKQLNICFANCVVDSQYIGDIFSVSPNLQTITFYEVTGISIEFMIFLTMCGIALVESLNIWCCDMSALSLRKFIHAAPNLKHLSVRNCVNISKEQCFEFKQLIKDLTVCYYNDGLILDAYFDF